MNTAQKIGSFVIVGAIVVLGVLFGVGVIRLPESPDVVFQKVAQAEGSVTSAEFSSTVTADITTPDTTTASGNSTNIIITVDGSGGKQSDGPAANVHFTVTGSGSTMSDVSVEGNFEFVNKLLYLEATKLPPLPIDTTPFINKWISIDPLALIQQAGGAAQTASLQTLLSGESSGLPVQFSLDVMNLAKTDGVIANITPAGNATINGVLTHAYTFEINTVKLADFIPDYMKLLNSYIVKQGGTAMTITPLTDEQVTALSQITIPNLEVWIGAKDYLPYQVKGTMALNDLGAPTVANGVSGTVSFDETVTAYNTAPVITAPTGAVPIEQFLQSALGITLPTTK